MPRAHLKLSVAVRPMFLFTKTQDWKFFKIDCDYAQYMAKLKDRQALVKGGRSEEVMFARLLSANPGLISALLAGDALDLTMGIKGDKAWLRNCPIFREFKNPAPASQVQSPSV